MSSAKRVKLNNELPCQPNAVNQSALCNELNGLQKRCLNDLLISKDSTKYKDILSRIIVSDDKTNNFEEIFSLLFPERRSFENVSAQYTDHLMHLMDSLGIALAR